MASARRELLPAGRKLFSGKGLYESRIEEITESADVGKGTLHTYFRNREALILAVVTGGFDDLRRQVEQRVRFLASALHRSGEGGRMSRARRRDLAVLPLGGCSCT
jgi:AcrR family transcriptional regulator